MPTITEEQLDEAFRFSQAYPDDPQVQEKAGRVKDAYRTQEVKALRLMYQDRERHGWDDETYNRVSSALSTRPQGKFEVINERFFADTYGLSSDQVRTMQKDLLEAYSTKTWGEPVTDDRAFYDRMGEEMDREDEVFSKGQQLALDGASGFEADAAFDFEYGADPKLKARADTLREQFRKAYDTTKNDLSSTGVSVDEFVEELQVSMGVKEEKGREPLPDSWFIENVLNMAPEKRDVFLSAVAARSGEGEEKSLLRASLEGLGRQATTMVRSMDNFERINLLSTLRDSVASGRIGADDIPEEYGFDPKKPIAKAFNPAKGFEALKSAPKQGTPEFAALSDDQKTALARIDKELEYITLYEKVNALAEGRIDPAKGSNWYTSGAIGAAKMVPNIAVMAGGPIGAILNIQSYAGQRTTDFLIENPGADPTDATRIGLATGIAQGLLDKIPTKIIQGKIPFFSSWLEKATLKSAGLFGRAAVRIGAGTVFEVGQEFSQDVLAPGVVEEIAQVLKKDLPGANWDKRLEAFKSPETLSELIPSIVMLSLIGTGVGSIKDYRGGWMLASSRRLLIGAGIDPESADSIVAAAKQQDATTTQTLLRDALAKVDAGPVAEVLPAAQRAAFASLAQEIEDKRTAVFRLEKSGVIPQIVPTKDGFEVVNPQGVKRTFTTREEAQTARWEYVAEQEIEVHEDLARVIDRLDRGIRPDQRKDRELDPETKTLLDAKREGQRTEQGAKARADKAVFLDDQGAPTQQAPADAETDFDIDAEHQQAVDAAILSSLDEDDRLAGMLIVGESSTEYRDRVYRTTVKLRNRATWATVIEEDSEGDAATMIQKGKRDWLADKLFAFDSDFQQGRVVNGKKLSLFEDGVTRETATDEDLIEAYSHLAQYYFVGTMKKGRQDGFKASEGFRSRYASAVRAGLSPIFDPLARLYRSIALRATRLEKMRRERRLDAELERELARSVGMTEQIEYEQQVNEEAGTIREEIDPDGVLEDPPKEKTFSVIQDDVVRPVGKKSLSYQLLKSPWMEQTETPVVDPTLLDYDSLHYKVTGPARKLLEAAVAGGHVDRAAERLVQETRAMLQYPDVASGSGWYGRMRVKLKKALGTDHELFTHLLGTTSAQTPVETNFQYAVEALVLFRAGKYNKQIQKYLEFLNFENIKDARLAMEKKRIVSKDETLSEAGLAQRWVEHYNLLPRRKNGGLYGSNSYPTLKALAGVWIKEKMTPKTPQFSMNLYGSNLQATIDVWAARTLRRILWGDVVQKWRILPEHETGVADEDFALGQMIFARAAKTLGMSPDDLQAIVWFGEKHIWEDRGWTSEIGALKSSFDEVAEVFFPEGAPARDLQLGKNIVRFIQKQRLFLGDLLSEDEFNALDPTSKEYKKQAKNRKKHEDDYQQGLKLEGVEAYLKSGGRDLVREFRTGGAPGQAASPDSVDGATPGGSDGGGGEQGTGSSFSVLSGGRGGRGSGDTRRTGENAATALRPGSPLNGAPRVEGATGPDLRIVDVARSYAQSIGIPFGRQKTYAKVDPDRATRIAQAYTDMKHDPTDPVVVEAYANLIEQTVAQYRALEKAGYTFWLYDKTNDPYPDSPYDAMRAIRANQSMGVFATEAGFGSSETASDTSKNSMMVDTGIRWPYGSPDGPLKRVLANDLFRAVHDAFGHGLEGSGFRGRGEENAWQAHVKLYTGSAVGAITSETRGQNSWLNFGPYGEHNQTASVEKTIFAEQKTGLMPEWTWTEGRVEHDVESTFSVMSAEIPINRMRRLMQQIDAMYSTGRTEGVENLEAELETLLEKADSDLDGMDEGDDADQVGEMLSSNIAEVDSANPSPEEELINQWYRWTGKGVADDSESLRETYPTFGAFVRAGTGDNAYVVQPGVTDAQIEEAAKESVENYERRRTAMLRSRVEKATFSVISAQDSEYLTLAKDPKANREKLRAMVDGVARAAEWGVNFSDETNANSTRFEPSRPNGSLEENGDAPSGLNFGPYFHGSQSAKINTFRLERRGAIFFAEDERLARDFGPSIYRVFLKIKKLADLTDTNSPVFQEFVEAFNNSGGWEWSEDAMEDRETSDFDPDIDLTWEIFDSMGFDAVEYLSRKGFDGVRLNETETQTSIAVFNPNQIKSADPVTYDEQGNVIALSQRFNPAKDESTFSVLSNAESRIADSFNPYFRSPDKRRKILLEAQFRSREKARDFQDIILAGRTVADLDQEQATREKATYGDLLVQYFGADTKEKIAALPTLDRKAARSESKRQAQQWRTMQDRQQKTLPRETLIAAMRTLDAMIIALPTEIRGKIGGMVRLATLTQPGAMVAELERRAKRLDDVLEDYLSKEADKQVKKLFKLARPAKDESGKAKKGKAGADIHDLFTMARRAWKTMSSTDAEAYAQGLEAAVASGNLTPEEEAHKLLEAELVRSFGGWNDRYTDSGKKDKNGRPIMTKVEDGADAVRKNHALDTATYIWKAGYLAYQQKKAAEKQQRDLMRAELRIATGKSGARPERVKAEEAGLKWKGAAKEKFFSILNFEQLVTWIFGPSPSAQWFIEQQRTAENKKIDAVQDVVDGVEDLFTKLAGGRFEGEKLQYRMMQRSIKAKSATGSIEPLSEMEAISALLMWMQEDGKRHMMGLRDDTGKLTTGWSYDQNFIDEISKQMTTEGWKVLSYLIAEYRKEYDTLNPIYREIYGINMPRNANYSPLTVKPGQAKQGQTIDPTTGSTVSSGSFTPGSLRTRAQVSAEPDFRDAISTFLSHKKQIEHWKAHAVFIRDAQGVLGNRELGNSVEASSGPEAVLLLRKWLDVLAQGGARDAATGTALMRLFDRMTGRAASMALVGRAGTVMIQATQLGAASAAMPTGAYLARLSRLMTGNLGWSKALNSEYIQRRVKSAPVAVRLAMDGLRSGSPTRTKHAVREIGKILSGADALFTAGTFAIVHDYTKSQAMKAGMSESDADTFALQEAERITENLAQPTRMGTRSYFEVTTTNPIYKLAWSFGSDSRKNFALLGYTMAKGTPAEKARALLFVVGVNGILSGLIRNIWRDMRDDEDEEVFDAKYWSLRRLAIAASTDWLFGFPIVGEEIQGAIYSALGEQRLDSGLFSAISQAPGAFKNLVIDWDSEDVLRDVEKIVMAAGLFNDQIAAGASVLHILRDVFDLSSNIIPD